MQRRLRQLLVRSNALSRKKIAATGYPLNRPSSSAQLLSRKPHQAPELNKSWGFFPKLLRV